MPKIASRNKPDPALSTAEGSEWLTVIFMVPAVGWFSVLPLIYFLALEVIHRDSQISLQVWLRIFAKQVSGIEFLQNKSLEFRTFSLTLKKVKYPRAENLELII